jgi:hypothetical protein
MTCDHCRGLNYVRTADHSVDACPVCAARAEAEWRLRHETIQRPALRLVKKEKAA